MSDRSKSKASDERRRAQRAARASVGPTSSKKRGTASGKTFLWLGILVIGGAVAFALSQESDDDNQAPSNTPAVAAPTNPSTAEAATPPVVVDPNQQYLSILDRFSVPQTADDEMIEIGRLICSNLDLGMSKEAAGLPLYYSGTEYSLGEAGSIVGAAINAYCPQHKDW